MGGSLYDFGKHNSGTERLAEVIEKMQIADSEIIVNIQGDEPLIPPVIVTQVAQNLDAYQVNMATLGVKLATREELFNPNAVKVVADKNGMALYFSQPAFRLPETVFRIVMTVLLPLKVIYAISAFTLTEPVL